MRLLTPGELKPLLTGGGEIAFLDVREQGQYGEGHPFLATPLPYSWLEAGALALLPRKGVRIVLLDAADGVAAMAAARLSALGYTDLAALEGGANAWATAGYTLFKGVNLPSKTFGEMVEHERGTPNISAGEFKAMQDRGDKFVLLDGRPVHEFRRMTIPGSTCCPNAELGHRLPMLVGDRKTPVVINCAGRTRSIIGAQTLREMGFANPVMALRDGTQGWLLAGYELEYGPDRIYPDKITDAALAESRSRAVALRERNGVPAIDQQTLERWRAEEDRTLYVLDVRTAAEFEAGRLAGSRHAPGGQLVQATDSWAAVRGARVVLTDDTGLRAAITAHWLRCMGHDAHSLDLDVSKLAGRETGPAVEIAAGAELPDITPAELASGDFTLLDVNAGMDYRKGHIDGARWACRPRLGRLRLETGTPVVLTAKDRRRAQLAALDLAEAGFGPIHFLAGGEADWAAAGLRLTETPNDPPEADCIDFLFFVHDRQNNLDHARGYLAWETALIGQLDAQERAVFRL